MATSFADTYPHIDEFVDVHGWVETGYDEYSSAFIRTLDMGGNVWMGQTEYASLDEVLIDLEQALAAWIKTNFGEG